MMVNFYIKKGWRQIVSLYILVFVVLSLFYLSLFHIPLLRVQQVLFYQGLFLLTVTSLISFAALFLMQKYIKGVRQYVESIVSAIIVSISINLVIFVVLPVTFDRSVSTYLLSTLGSHASASCQGLTKQQLEDDLISQYVLKNKALQKRIIEQEEIGFIQNRSKCITLTNRARNFLQLKQLVEKLYHMN